MLVPSTTAVLVAVLLLALAATWYLLRDRLVDDRLLLVAALLEVLLVVQAVICLVVMGRVPGRGEGATMLAYALTLPFIPPFVLLVAIKEKTRWAMGVVIAGAFTVAVMTYRIVQIWATARA